MKITPLDDDNGRKVLQIEADWSELVPDYDDIVAGYSKVRLSGFRQGKVPRAVIEKRFRREIMKDLSSRYAERLGREAIRETGIEALGPVEAEAIECEKNRRFRIQVRFHPMPEIALPDINNLKIDAGGVNLRDQISQRLLDLVVFEVPDGLVKNELALDGIAGGDPQSQEWKAAEERVRLMLILKRIARQEGIEVEEADMNNRIAEKAKEFGTTKEALKKELEEGGGRARLRDMLLAERTLEYLVEAK
jgi:FKBP-type peptidyl-prolyl cis-trans isomerase (trigger factor)